MQPDLQLQRAKRFRELHQGQPLVLVNAWDAGSARLLESCGALAIATTSAAMAWSLGYADGERLPVNELINACQRICRVVSVPVSVDIERGYGQTPAEIPAILRALLDIGVVGINIEDGIDRSTGKLHEAGVLAERIAAIRATANARGVPLFINARTDTYFIAAPDPVARYEDTVRRARIYVDAGADGIFVPGLADIREIENVARAVPRPLNIYAYSGVPPVSALATANVRRVSLGCGPLQASFALTRRIAIEALEQGAYAAMTADMFPVDAANALFAAPTDTNH